MRRQSRLSKDVPETATIFLANGREALIKDTASPRRLVLAVLSLCVLPPALQAADRWNIGLASDGTKIQAIAVEGLSASSPTVVLVGGVEGKDETADIVTRETEAYEKTPQARRRFRLLAIPVANPAAKALQFPPSGVAYRENIESHVLWRWIGIHAPDLVLIAAQSDFGMAEALTQNAVGFVGRIPARRVEAKAGAILQSVPGDILASEARGEIEKRLKRSPRALAEELAQIYGRDFSQPTYIPAMAIIGQLRLGRTSDVMRLAAPYLDGSIDSLAKPSQGALAGHMLFFEIARKTGDERAKKLVRRAADIGFTESGEMREFMPLHGGWSDSVFMDIPILAKAGALTGERKYFDMAARHFSFMQKIVFRPDGLYRHQASTDAAWSRGNAFPALGLALTLSDFPKDHPEFPRMLAAFQQHMKTLAKFQDENGMWRNVIDHPGAYPEFSATAMIGTALLRGIRNGWLDETTYRPLVDKAWRAILTRTSSDGRVFDISESTGTRGLSYDDYIRRAAILDRDPRGGAMAMIFATEMEGLQ
jgi:rhamnogalacturonyl hydrolase YesR